MKRVQQFLKSDTPNKWLFYGDSITHGALHTFGSRDYTEHFSERVRTELGRSQDVVIKTAISGNTTRQLLADFPWRLEQFRPQVVFLMIGMNDCATERNLGPEMFSSNLHELCRQIEEIGGLPVMQTTCPILPGTAASRECNFSRYMEIIRTVARERELPLVDHEAYWLANPAKHYYWMNNGFHPNGFGHLAFAHCLFKALDCFDPNSNVCRLFVP